MDSEGQLNTTDIIFPIPRDPQLVHTICYPNPAASRSEQPVPQDNLQSRRVLGPVVQNQPTGDSNNCTTKINVMSIKDKNYGQLRKLGSGESSEVFKVFEIEHHKEYALKIVNLANRLKHSKNYLNEVHVLRELQGCDNIIKLFDYELCLPARKLKMLLEVGDTDLESFIKARGEQRLPIAMTVYYWQEMLQAVNYIHCRGIVHADLKPRYFLIVRGRLKLIDCGISLEVLSHETSIHRHNTTGSLAYISPEALAGGAGTSEPFNDFSIQVTNKTDVWSLGCILYYIIYGTTPFGHIPSIGAKVFMIANPNHVIKYPKVEDAPLLLIRSLMWCLQYDAEKRPSAAELLDVNIYTGQHNIPEAINLEAEPYLTANEQLLRRNEHNEN